jgi:hypothetical protein
MFLGGNMLAIPYIYIEALLLNGVIFGDDSPFELNLITLVFLLRLDKRSVVEWKLPKYQLMNGGALLWVFY